MTRRITIPEDHVALIISARLADELASLMRTTRQQLWARIERCKRADLKAGHGSTVDSSDCGNHQICGDVMLALLEAKEG